MTREWLVYSIVAALGIAAGVAIAGLPDDSPVDATITAPPTTGSGPVTLPPTTAPRVTPEATAPTTAAPTTVAPTTTTSSASTAGDVTSGPVETVPPGPSPTTSLRDRSELTVLVANGAFFSDVGRRTAAELRELGYDRAFFDDGTVLALETRVYARDGLEAEGRRLAADLGLRAVAPGSLDDAPEAENGIDDLDLYVYVGRDRT